LLYLQRALTCILSQVVTQLGLSFKNVKELNDIIDRGIPRSSRPMFQREEIIIGNEAYNVYFRDVIECIRALYGDPEFAPYLVFRPEEHYVDDSRQVRLFHDMHTGRWWWSTQVCFIISQQHLY
jgi:hypothetical protein